MDRREPEPDAPWDWPEWLTVTVLLGGGILIVGGAVGFLIVFVDWVKRLHG